MLAKTAVIVLGSVKYGDTSIILKTYSREHGLLSFIAGNVRGKKTGPLRSSMIQVLNQLEVVFYPHSKSDIKRLKEVRVPQPYQSISFDPYKNCISLFLAEVIRYFIREEEVNVPLYTFMSEAFYLLDATEEGTANFHLVFLYQLSTYLGFKPEEPSPHPFFDLVNGIYTRAEPPHGQYLSDPLLEQWKTLAETDLNQLTGLRMSGDKRRALVEKLLVYYRLHLKDFGELKSLDVLHAVLR